MNEYVIYGAIISLFSRKLEAAFRFYGAPHQLRAKDGENGPEIESRAKTHQVPVLQTPENWMIADTTPIIAMLDGRFPSRRLFPAGPQGVLVHVVEDILDEWTARAMVHYRWHYDENTRHTVSTILGRELTVEQAKAFPLAQWGPRACRATGTESEYQQEAVEREYMGVLGALEQQLESSRYALGDRPTAVDTILLGSLRAHINRDPIPDLAAFPKVVSWDERDADRWDGSGELAEFPKSTAFANHILDLGRDCYSDFALGNARALAAGEKAFVIETYGQSVSYKTRDYPERARLMVHDRIRQQLDSDERKRVGEWLEERGLAACYMPV